MKRLFLLLLPGMVFLAESAEAQLQKGTGYWGGTINFSGEFFRYENEYDQNDVSKSARPTIAPEVQAGWFVSNKTMLGIGARYGLNYQRTVEESSGYKSRSVSQSLQILPFIRQYYGIGDRWAIFIHGELGPNYSWSKVKYEGTLNEKEKNDYWQYGLALKPGVVYTFPNKKWSVEAYTNFLSLNFNYFPYPDDHGREFRVTSGLNTGFPSYFSLRIARFIQPKN